MLSAAFNGKRKLMPSFFCFFLFLFFSALQCACTGRASTRVALEMR